MLRAFTPRDPNSVWYFFLHLHYYVDVGTFSLDPGTSNAAFRAAVFYTLALRESDEKKGRSKGLCRWGCSYTVALLHGALGLVGFFSRRYSRGTILRFNYPERESSSYLEAPAKRLGKTRAPPAPEHTYVCTGHTHGALKLCLCGLSNNLNRTWDSTSFSY